MSRSRSEMAYAEGELDFVKSVAEAEYHQRNELAEYQAQISMQRQQLRGEIGHASHHFAEMKQQMMQEENEMMNLRHRLQEQTAQTSQVAQIADISSQKQERTKKTGVDRQTD